MVITGNEVLYLVAAVFGVLALTFLVLFAVLFVTRRHPSASWIWDRSAREARAPGGAAGVFRGLLGGRDPVSGEPCAGEVAGCPVTGRRCASMARGPYRSPADGDALVIRPLTSADAYRLIELAQQGEPTANTRDWEAGEQLQLGAECNGRLIGAVLACHDSSDHSQPRATLRKVLVDQTCRSHGAANLLVIRILEKLRTQSGRRLQISLTQEAWHLLRNCGWSPS